MKKVSTFVQLLAALVLLVVAFALPAVAGNVADRELVTTTGGTQLFTNTAQYAAIELKRIWVEGAVIPGNTVTVTRVVGLAYGGYTQAVGSVVCTSGAGSTASFTGAYLLPNELLRLVGLSSSNFNSIIEYEVQQH